MRGSAAFKAAAVAAVMIPRREVKITLIDNQSIAANIMTIAPESDTVYFPKGKAVNGITVKGAKWAFPDPYLEGAGGRMLADGTLYPIDIGQEGGWQGVKVSDNSGNIAGGGEQFYVLYDTLTPVSTLNITGDSHLGYPVDFSVDYDPGTGIWANLGSVTGNASPVYNLTLGSPGLIKGLKFTITKINYGQQPIRIIEFQGGVGIDQSAAVASLSTLQERYPDNATASVGNASAGTLSLTQDNTGGLWGPHSSSIYAAYLRANRKITVQVGLVLPDTSVELIPLGTFYSMDWQAGTGSPIATVKAQDRMKKLRERKYLRCPLQIGQTVDICILRALTDAGFGVNEYVLEASTTVIPYAGAQPSQSFFEYIAQLAAVDGGVVYVDEADVLRFQSASWLHNNSTVSQFTFTDNNATVDASDRWSDGDVRNRIVVNINALKLKAAAVIWNAQETLTVPGRVAAGGTATVTAAGTGWSIGYNGADIWVSQSLLAVAGQVTQITLTLGANTGAPTGDILWQLQTDSAGKPSGIILASGTFTPVPSATNTIPVPSGPTIAAGTYHLVFKTLIVQVATNYFLGQASNANPYASGTLTWSSDGGSSWTIEAAYDMQCSLTTVAVNGSLTVDAKFNSMATGITTPAFTAGADITLTSWVPYAYGVRMVFSNSNAAAETITVLTITGQTLEADGQQIATAETAAVTSEKETPREMTISNPFIQSRVQAQNLASTLLAIYAVQPAKTRIESVGLPHLQLGDRVTVNSARLGIVADFWVIRHEFQDDGGWRSSIDAIAVV